MPNTHITAFSATKILLPIDFSSSSDAALEAATGLAEQFHAGIHLVHIIPGIPDWNGSDFFPETSVLQERREVIQEKLAAYKEQLSSQGVSASFSIEEGNDIVGNLMRVIQREGADLLVISTHGLSGWHPLIFGSIAQEVIKQMSCTLLLLQANLPAPTATESVWENSFVPQVSGMEHSGSMVAEPGAASGSGLERAADELAQRGGRTEQEYDQAHSLFTK